MLKPSLTRLPRGFTLIELLVVITIMALLISVLLPSLKQARATAQSVQCLSNLRGLAQSTVIYTDTSLGYFPVRTFNLPEDVAAGRSGWQGPILRMTLVDLLPKHTDYVKPRTMKLCPSVAGTPLPYEANDTYNNYSHYMTDAGLVGSRNYNTHPTAWQINGYRTHRIQKVRRAGETYVFADARYWTVVDSRPDVIESVPNTDYWFGPNNGGPGFNPNKPGTIVAGASSGTLETTTNVYQGFRHALGANFVFIDGSGSYRKFDPTGLTGGNAIAPKYVQNSAQVTPGEDNFIGGYGRYRIHHFQSIIPN